MAKPNWPNAHCSLQPPTKALRTVHYLIKLSTAFRNRFTAYYIGANVKQWREDFANKSVHPAILAYASLYPDRVENFKVPENNLLNFPSLRGLTMLGQDVRYFEARNFVNAPPKVWSTPRVSTKKT